MQKTKFYTLAAIGGLVVTTLVVSGVASASVGNSTLPADRTEQRAQIQEHQEEMQSIMENGDYDSWATKMREKANGLCQHAEEIRGDINQETFGILQQAHQLKVDGDYESAKQLLSDNGLNFGLRGMGRGPRDGRFHRGSGTMTNLGSGQNK